DWRAVDAKAVVAAMIGADVEFEINSGGPWTGGLAGRRALPVRGRGFSRRCRASVHAAGRTGGEHRHRRRDEFVLEARGRAARLGPAAAPRTRPARARTHRRA